MIQGVADEETRRFERELIRTVVLLAFELLFFLVVEVADWILFVEVLVAIARS